MQARDRFLDSGGITLRYRDEGGGAPVVFIHGWTLDLEVWNPQASTFAHAMRVVRHDRRGFGLSEGTPSLAADVEDLHALLDHLELPAAAIVGASQGARVALDFALRHPERVSALVLDGPPDEIGEAEGGAIDNSIDELRALARTGGIEEFRVAWRNHPLMRLYSADEAARALVAAMLARYPARDLLATAEVRPPPRGAAAVARLSRPVLVVNGERDMAARLRAGEHLARALADAKRVVVAGAGHLPNLDNPQAYDAEIAAFLRRRTRVAA